MGCKTSSFDFVWSNCATQHAARDATQETAVRLLAGLSRFRGQSRVTTWALGIALNVCREHRRRSRREPPQSTRDDVAPASDEPAINRETLERLGNVLAQLSDRQRHVVVLRYFEELDVNDTAAVMGVAPGTVKATLWQALRRMRTLMESNDG